MGLFTAFKRMVSGVKPLASDMNQLIDGFSAGADVGQMAFYLQLPTPSAPTVSVNATSGVMSGGYQYVVVNVTGWTTSDGNTYVAGFAPSASSVTVSPSSQQVNVTFAVGPTGTIGRLLYRTASNGTTFKFLKWFGDNTTTSYTDNTADANIGTGMPSLNGNAIPSTVPNGNTTGTSIAGINAMSHGPSLNALFQFENSLYSSRGLQATFSRSSSANNPSTLATVGNNVPRFAPGKFGNGIFIEEGTTNLVNDSDFETVTSTATVFSDALTSYTGSSAAPWTITSGSWTFGASGATSGSQASQLLAGNNAWKPLTGSGGQNLSMTLQATFTMPSSVPTYQAFSVKFWLDGSNDYEFWANNNTLGLAKKVSGTGSSVGTSISYSLSSSTTYTATFARDTTGLLTAKLYSGTGTGGTLLQTLTATDTSLSGGFLVGVGGDTGVVVSNVSVTAPWADGWGVGYDSRVAWALTQSAINGAYSISGKGVSSGIRGTVGRNVTGLSASTNYAFSAYMNTSGIGASGAYLEVDFQNGGSLVNSITSSHVTGTTTTQRIVAIGTSGAGVTNANIYIELLDAGNVTFDCIMLENKPYCTTYERNDSTTATATRNAETLTVPASVLNASAGTLSMWVSCATLSNSYQILFDTRSSPSLNNSGLAAWVRNNQIVVNVATGSSSSQIFNGTIAPSNLNHIAVSWSTAGTKLYINGVLNASSATQSIVGSKFGIGCDGNGGTSLDGTIDELCIFNTALSDAQVYALYAKTQPLIDAFQSPVAPDITTYNQSSTSPDSNDVYTTVTYTRQDGSKYMSSTLSGTPPAGTSQYPTMTWTYYDATGTVTTRTQTFSLTYDASGKLISQTMTN